MKGTQHTFKRYEKKYLLTPEQYGRILPELGREMREDEYGQYTICNIYYDTQSFELVLVGETLVQTVKKGYLAAGGDKEKIRTVPTLKDAQELLAKELATGDTVLFLNDLPDIYVT